MSTALRVLCLAGPTGVGKTAAALGLARFCNAEVVNADSRQVYADFPCITAQPSAEERAVCPHHLYGFLPTAEKISAGRWVDNAIACAREIASRGKVPLFVGGTGLYFKALVEGMAAIPPVPPEVSQRVWQRCLEEGPASVYAELQQIDPVYAARIHPNDKQRIARALEVFAATGRPLSWWHVHGAAPAPCEGLMLGLATTLDALTPRLARRIDLMLEQGAEAEARAALTRCADPTAPGWSGIGCAELFQYIHGFITLQECKELWTHNTRAYAKRQLTWFRAVRSLTWFAPDDVRGLCEKAQKFLVG